MANSSDFIPDDVRWAITSGLVRPVDSANPAGATKDAGYVPLDPLNVSADNWRFGSAYVGFLLLLVDLLPLFEPWNGVMPGSPGPVIAADTGGRNLLITNGPVRYWLGGHLVTIADATLDWGTPVGVGAKQCYLAVELNPTTRVGAYVIVVGTVSALPVLASNQYAIATFTAEFTAGVTVGPTKVVLEGGRRRSRSQRIRRAAGAGTPYTLASTLINIETSVAVALGSDSTDVGALTFDLSEIPVGATITEVRAHHTGRSGSTTYGMLVSLRAYKVGTGDLGKASATNEGDPIAAGVGVISLVPTAAQGLVAADEAPYVRVQGVTANPLTSSGSVPKLAALEVFYTLPEAS